MGVRGVFDVRDVRYAKCSVVVITTCAADIV